MVSADSYDEDPTKAVSDADLVIVSVPVGASGARWWRQIAGSLKPGAILTDVGSTKNSVIAQMRPHVPTGVHFIPGHPLAGTEKSGPDAGFAEFVREPLVHPDAVARHRPGRAREAVGLLARLRLDHRYEWIPSTMTWCWRFVSHLPHIIAYNIVGTADDLESVTKTEVIKVLGFRLPRLHALGRFRPDDVAGRVPAQQGRDPGDAGALLRRPFGAAKGDPLG